MTMKVVEMNLSELKPSDYNPRKALKPTDKEYKDIKSSIERFGMVQAIVFNKKTGNIVGGHQRYTVLKDMNVESVPVTIVDIDDKEEKALNIALNNVKGEWDNQKLESVIADIMSEGDQALSGVLGFNENELDTMLKNFSNRSASHFLTDLETVNDDDLDNMDDVEELEEIDENNEPTERNDHNTPSENTGRPSDSFQDSGGINDAGDYSEPQQDAQSLYVDTSFSVTAEQRTIIMRALGLAKEHYNTHDRGVALYQLCKGFLKLRENGDDNE